MAEVSGSCGREWERFAVCEGVKEALWCFAVEKKNGFWFSLVCALCVEFRPPSPVCRLKKELVLFDGMHSFAVAGGLVLGWQMARAQRCCRWIVGVLVGCCVD